MPSAPQSPLTGMTVCAQNGQEHSATYVYDQSQLQFAQSKPIPTVIRKIKLSENDSFLSDKFSLQKDLRIALKLTKTWHEYFINLVI